MTVLVDVTERNRARRELERNVELFQRLYRETPAMLHSVDPDGRLVEVSDYWLMKLGYQSREEVLGRPFVEFHPPAQRLRAQQCVEEFWQTGAPVWNRAYDFLRKDGTTFEVELSVIVAKPKGEAEARSLAVSFDVTERNRARRELERKNNELQRLNEELDTFASVASHDLQEPLRKIRKFAEVLEEELPASLTDDGAYALGAMRAAVQRMQRLIGDLLDYARTANAAMVAQPVDLMQVVERVNDDLSVAISEADARISTGALPVITGDEQQVRQLFQNLIENAVKYRDHTKRCEIDIVAEPADSDCGWRVSVRDNGIGFDQRAAEAIFLPFRRLQPRSRSGGSGLGLTICGRIAERHGWSLKAQSAPGQGSTFTLEIPAAEIGQYLNAPGGGATGMGATQSMV
jgi:PAS domain S-box-containing protein